jgi:putative oxidoreductase
VGTPQAQRVPIPDPKAPVAVARRLLYNFVAGAFSPPVAAVTGAGGELFFPALLFPGLFSRVGALGAFFVNAIAVVSYRQVLLAEGSEAALGQHVLWSFMLLVLAVFGPGRVALDTWLEGRLASRSRPLVHLTTTAAAAMR